MITITESGSFKNTESFLTRALKLGYTRTLHKYGAEGVRLLSDATPVDSGETAHSWSYRVSSSRNSYTIGWYNSNVNDGVPIAILLQYGHGTKNGAFVQGIDYINPAISPIFYKIADDLWEEVTKL